MYLFTTLNLKRQLLLTLTCLAFYCHVPAQNQKQVVEGNDDINANIPDSIKYKYRSFISGIVTFKNGTQGGALLNYNLLSGEVQFVSPKGDTLALANEHTIKNISIGQDTFYYDNLYLQSIQDNANSKLAKTEKMHLADLKKMGAFGTYTSSGGIQNYTTLNIGSRTLHLEENKELIFVTRTSYYLGDQYNHFLPATKKNVLKMFNKKGLEIYINENKIDFHNEEDIKKILAFLSNTSQ